ncbi:head GIN domain-containing protein [Maribacter halichondriae]|uniref:head GIN domain-containing protein n=1 Tax=Maribacter halichondriae TaxID=2980554 RepID=UPI002358EBF0|nr:head GIN domain-containing protein [Maribacter sp. Hal144]
MKKLVLPLVLLTVLGLNTLVAQEKTYQVDHFDKIIISPHIAVNLIEGDEESVRIDQSGVSDDKINVKMEGNTLRIYLDGAKMVTKNDKVKDEKYNMTKSIYEGTMVKATVTYKKLNTLSVRGEERINLKSKIAQKEFTLRIYGESQVYLSDVDLEKIKTTIYGESYLEIENGNIDNQRYIAYGESRVNSMSINNTSTKITAYGQSDFRVNVSDRLKVTCYGETHITYEGDPDVDRGIVIGEATIRKIG